MQVRLQSAADTEPSASAQPLSEGGNRHPRQSRVGATLPPRVWGTPRTLRGSHNMLLPGKVLCTPQRAGSEWQPHLDGAFMSTLFSQLSGNASGGQARNWGHVTKVFAS